MTICNINKQMADMFSHFFVAIMTQLCYNKAKIGVITWLI